MRKLLLLLALTLFAAACGESETAAPAANPAAQVDVASNQVVVRTAVQGSTTDVVINEAGVQARQEDALLRMQPGVSKNATAYVLGLQVCQLFIINTGPMGRVIPSPLGGSVDVTVNGTTATAVFTEFRTLTATLNGTTTASLTNGTVQSGSYAAALTFTAMQVTTAQGSYRLDGTATLSRSRSAQTVDSIWTVNLTAQDVNGASLTFQNFTTVSHVTLNAGGFEATQTYAGTVSYAGVAGPTGALSGTLTVSTPTAFRYVGTTSSFQLLEGQMLLSGQAAGTLRVTVTAPNTLELALVQPNGTVIVLETASWESLGGSTSTQ
ncbi:MAG: hypothetical protein AB1758_28790 [Candidatus Eremiobacterota bacterium]